MKIIIAVCVLLFLSTFAFLALIACGLAELKVSADKRRHTSR